MAGKLISDLNSGILSLADAMEIDKDVSGTRTSFKTTVKDIVDFANHNVAEEYDSTSTYAIGDYVMYESTLYKCITDVSSAENFDSTKWTAVLVTDEMGSGGGGGTGGHTIIDENGNSMPARTGLQFVGGANVSDDATNNRTIVDLASAGGIDGVFIDTENVITSGTYSASSPLSYTATEDCIVVIYLIANNSHSYLYIDNVMVYDVFSNGTQVFAPMIMLKKGQTLSTVTSYSDASGYTIYGIQTGTTHSKFQPIIYSLEEREIGVWTDGKPLYEKTIYYAGGVSGETSFAHNISNIENIAKIDAICKDTYGSGDIRYLIPRIGGDGNDIGIKSVDSTNITYFVPNVFTNRIVDIYVTLQYTKTTDTAGSGSWTPQGVPAHHYSTDEQIIGTWIDGSPIYEKSYYIASPSTNSDTKFSDSSLSSIGVCISIDGTYVRVAGGGNNIMTYKLNGKEEMYGNQDSFVRIDHPDGNNIGITYYLKTTDNVRDLVVTIRYTKSS